MIQKFDVTITPFGLPRTVHLYLPAGYEKTAERYPVLYFYDGHNLFSDEDATYGKSWGLGDYLDRCGKGFIAVGVECNHEGNGRLVEYYPFGEPVFGAERGLGDVYMRWVVEELKPYIDSHYRTLPGRESAMIGGSSMGGLMAAYSVIRHNDVFSKAACLSSSISLCMPQLLNLLEECPIESGTRVYLDWGGREAGNLEGLIRMTDCNLTLAHRLAERDADVYPRIIPDGEHCEASWERQIPVFMSYLWGI